MKVHKGSCHCGAVKLELREDPLDVSECNCSICRRIAGLWYYCHPEAATITGEGVAYIHGDRMLTTWHCGTCGCTTHWTAIDPAYDKMGLNLRMFDPELWRDLPRKFVDGASF
ncbi:GFA family protein [Parerythrobacter aestuarii]|uniref:GFA family protein n=1 Tax=Parerythrobacter aestuarii TaxID=3020909 RepID=UPI0024DECC74|nr:GFA family protein [Parerythrobacter aestuarii]